MKGHASRTSSGGKARASPRPILIKPDTFCLQRVPDFPTIILPLMFLSSSSAGFVGVLANLAVPLLFLGGLFLLSRRSGGGGMGGPGQNQFNMGKSKGMFCDLLRTNCSAARSIQFQGAHRTPCARRADAV